MYICFVEYRIMAEYREHFLIVTEKWLETDSNMRLYEGTDQLNLFVEVWQASTAEEAERMKEERCSERSPWYSVSEWIVGGSTNMHIWTFKPVVPNS